MSEFTLDKGSLIIDNDILKIEEFNGFTNEQKELLSKFFEDLMKYDNFNKFNPDILKKYDSEFLTILGSRIKANIDFKKFLKFNESKERNKWQIDLNEILKKIHEILDNELKNRVINITNQHLSKYRDLSKYMKYSGSGSKKIKKTKKKLFKKNKKSKKNKKIKKN